MFLAFFGAKMTNIDIQNPKLIFTNDSLFPISFTNKQKSSVSNFFAQVDQKVLPVSQIMQQGSLKHEFRFKCTFLLLGMMLMMWWDVKNSDLLSEKTKWWWMPKLDYISSLRRKMEFQKVVKGWNTLIWKIGSMIMEVSRL